MFLPSSYFQRRFDNFDWFLVYIETTVLEFYVIDFLQVLLLFYFIFFFFQECVFCGCIFSFISL